MLERFQRSARAPKLAKPIEVKIADAIFLKMQNNMVLFKDLSNPKVHYSCFIIGSKFDFHIARENQADSKKSMFNCLNLRLIGNTFLKELLKT
jgi:hypothetical protein